MPAYRFDSRRFQMPHLGPFTRTLVVVTGGILIAGIVALLIAFGVVILAVVGVLGLIATAWHQIRRRIQHSPAAVERAHVEEVREKHGYTIVQEAEVITLDEPSSGEERR